MQPMQILVLGPEGLGRSALEETLTRLGYVVMAAEARPDRTPPASGDIVMLDLRGEDADWRGLAEGLLADERPVMIVSERPRPPGARPLGPPRRHHAPHRLRVGRRLPRGARRVRRAPRRAPSTGRRSSGAHRGGLGVDGTLITYPSKRLAA